MLNDFGESKVTVKKEELLNAIRKNRETHRESFLEAQKGYRDTVIKALDQTLAEAREGQRFVLERITALVMPQEHTTDYDRVIKMLEMCVADEVTVTEQQFSQYVLDDWGWKKQFIATNSRYSR
jgi:hypothetical protein